MNPHSQTVLHLEIEKRIGELTKAPFDPGWLTLANRCSQIIKGFEGRQSGPAERSAATVPECGSSQSAPDKFNELRRKSAAAAPESQTINAAPQGGSAVETPALPGAPAVAAPTPRTDRAQFAAIPDAGRGSRFVVEADFARQLERELAGMTAARDRTADLLREAIEENTKLRDAVYELMKRLEAAGQ